MSNASKSLEGRIALITGASRGIGAAVAKRYAAEGAHVILVGRTVSGLEEVDDAIAEAGGQATLVPADITDAKKMDALAVEIGKRFGKLDILVANAAMLGGLGPLVDFDPKDWNKIIATNVTANFHLLRSLDPLLKVSDAARVLFVTSGVTQITPAFWAPYTASKAAVEAMLQCYAKEVEHQGIVVSLIDPGVAATSMRAEAMPGEDPATLPSPEEIAEIFVKPAMADYNETGQRLSA